MKFINQVFFVALLIISMTNSQSLDSAGIDEAEKNFEDRLDLVLSDLNAEIAAKNRTFIAQKIAQIRARKSKFPSGTDLTSAKFEKRLKRKRMKKKCVAMAKRFQGSGMLVRRKVW
jgi:hypothetical protein